MTVLRPCEVYGQDEVNGPMRVCGAPGKFVVSPTTGKTYILCDRHLAVFVNDCWPIALNDGSESA